MCSVQIGQVMLVMPHRCASQVPNMAVLHCTFSSVVTLTQPGLTGVCLQHGPSGHQSWHSGSFGGCYWRFMVSLQGVLIWDAILRVWLLR